MPIQGALRPDKKGQVEIFPEFCEGLKDIDGFSHLILLYHFHMVDGYNLTSRPFLDNTPRGVFSIRGPRRPNPIGMTVVQLLKVENHILNVAGVDMVDGTPLLDIKPYLPDIDAHQADRTGWMGEKLKTVGKTTQSDDRFVSKPD